ncbi:cytochrome c maturation protein CcmE [Pseudidiomarina taiwanensis]|uniref:Cytochrome c-type biogenesis protein CcmE n=1 Tax=Pseudidiomarina taiwanensis TaxID=337250 RepID=A0A432ZK71_9GAMM|nr:cytochrome c maturation protein CcmE [Pseudidiomarina taiwanensis]RUO78339.1 cytochrome c maturation protein CcmE [Pseudidiomarina taiwanensis]
MIPRRKKRLGWTLGLVFGVAASLGLILYAMSEQVDLFYTPSQVHDGLGADKVKPVVGQRLRIGGMVVEGSVQRNPQTLEVSFRVTDTGPEVTILYQGILPDLFREGQGIVAQGVMIEPLVLEATEVLAKHDEEYMPPELAEQMKGIKHVNPNSNEAYNQDGGSP